MRALLLTSLLLFMNGCRPAPLAASQPSRESGSARLAADYVVAPLTSADDRPHRELRIVCGAPSVTEICAALGAADQIVGRTDYCTHPPEIQRVPSIGALVDTHVETLLALRPDVVLVAGSSRAITERLAPLSLRVESAPDASLEDIFVSIQRIGGILGRPSAARQLSERIRADLTRIDDEFRGLPRRRVLIVPGTLKTPPRPPFVAGPHSFYDDLIRRAGHQNAAGETGIAFGPLSLEVILRENPDVILELDPDGVARPGGDAEALVAWAEVGPLEAVASRRVHVIRGPQHYLPGPRVAETYEAICRAIAGRQGRIADGGERTADHP